MNVIVIGLGSMGKRRIRLLKQIDKNVNIVGVDASIERRKEAAELVNISSYESIEEAKEATEVQCAFVCTSPLSHREIITECLTNGWHVFTELNLVADGYEDNIKLAKANNCVLFLSSTFFYREEITYIREQVNDKRNLNYIYHIGQYLPDWHPWENYKDFFVGDKRTNGCREIMAIELPWLTETFGEVVDYSVKSDKITDLAISYNDNYMIQLSHKNGNKGMLIVDVVCPKAVRNLEIYGENVYLCWDGTPPGLKQFDSDTKEIKNIVLYDSVERVKGYSSFVIENAYKNEIQEFLDVVAGNVEPQYGFDKDMQILKLIDRLEGLK